MDHVFPIILLLVFFANGAISYAALPAEVYWHKVLPNTPMPSAIRDLIRPDEKPSTSFNVQNGAYQTNYPRYYPPPKSKRADSTKRAESTESLSFFFLKKNLHPGAKLHLQLSRAAAAPAFLPLTTARTIPFSTQRLPEILSHFSIKLGSPEARVMKDSLEECEDKHCSTSLESMVDFITSELGTHEVRLLANPGRSGAPMQQYTVGLGGMKRVLSTNLVACHPEPYPNAVFQCHYSAKGFGAYVVPLVGKDGSKVDAVAACHTDTALWDPNFLGFQVLKVKPGSVPVCHFLPPGHIIWAPAK